MCDALKVTRQGYYAWKRRPPSAHAMRDEELATMISQVRAEVRDIYGALKAFLELRRSGVRKTPLRREARIEEGLRRRPGQTQVQSRRPNRAWFADISYVKTRQGWLYLALVMDIWSRRAVDWAMGSNITPELADEALKMALARRGNPRGCIHHSNHGSQCMSLMLSKTMREHGIRLSMGSISSPWDNAAMESLMGLVKSEGVHAWVYATRDEAVLDLLEHTEVIYNRSRTRTALGYLNSAEFEEANWPNDEGRPKASMESG